MAWAGGVTEPADDWNYHGSSPFCKEDFKNGKTPCLLLVPPEETDVWWGTDEYTKYIGNKNVVKIYYNQPWDVKFRMELEKAGCKILGLTAGSELKWTGSDE